MLCKILFGLKFGEIHPFVLEFLSFVTVLFLINILNKNIFKLLLT